MSSCAFCNALYDCIATSIFDTFTPFTLLPFVLIYIFLYHHQIAQIFYHVETETHTISINAIIIVVC